MLKGIELLIAQPATELACGPLLSGCLRGSRVKMADIGTPRSKTIRSMNNGFAGGPGNPLEHSAEDPLMEGIQAVPVKKPG
jgi:hypothetical protein